MIEVQFIVSAFYCIRVLQNPTPRVALPDIIAQGVEPNPGRNLILCRFRQLSGIVTLACKLQLKKISYFS